jgi:capsular polysaccharide transport system permease protein
MGANTTLSSPRTPLDITVSVWKALFLREAVSRLSTGRAAWLWLLLEPVFSIAFLMFVFTALRMHTVGGISTAIWLMLGMLAFFMFRRTGTQAMNAIDANQALFGYRQVKPIDTVLVRAGLEGFLMILIAIILCFSAGLLGFAIVPADPLMVLAAFCGLWLTGLGFGLITSVAKELVPEVGRFIDLFMTPLYFFSGVMFPVNAVPHPYYEWLMYNPLIHGLEATRLAFAPDYRAIPELNISYLYSFALITIFFGLALQNRFAARLVTQ